MEKQAISKYVRISAFKARQVTRLIQGQSVATALSIVDTVPRKAARLVGKTLRSAIANVESDPDLLVSQDDLLVKVAVVGEGPTLRRYQPRARGSAGRIRKRSSHIRIVLTDTPPAGGRRTGRK